MATWIVTTAGLAVVGTALVGGGVLVLPSLLPSGIGTVAEPAGQEQVERFETRMRRVHERGQVIFVHPFEAAGLGTAIVHGPVTGEHPAHWQALDRAGGARQIHGPLALPRVIEELAEPDTAARLARAAWEVATRGAEITTRIAEAVLSDLQESC